MSLDDQLNAEYADGWKPGVGDSIKGVVTEINVREGNWGPYPILTLQRDDGERVVVHAFHFVLQDELRRIRPQVGHRIGIKYLGRPEGKNYDVYRVATD